MTQLEAGKSAPWPRTPKPPSTTFGEAKNQQQIKSVGPCIPKRRCRVPPTVLERSLANPERTQE